MENEKKFIVYVHTNKINWKMYVGITSQSPKKRWRNGKGYTDSRRNKNTKFKYAIEKYGWHNFEHDIIASNLTEKEAINFEILLIDKLSLLDDKFGYNMSSGGKGPNMVECSECTSKLIAKRYWEREHDNHIPVICLNNKKIYSTIKEASKKTNASRGGISGCCKGEFLSSGTDEKTGERLIWKYLSEYNNDEYVPFIDPRRKPVICITTGKKYKSLQEALFDTGILAQNIGISCRDKTKYAGKDKNTGEKMYWMFLSDYEMEKIE